MNNLADAVLDYLWLIEFSEEDEFAPDLAVKLQADLLDKIENQWLEGEKQALCEAAKIPLAWWTQEPDEHGFMSCQLLKPNQKALLQALSLGRFSGYDFDETED